MCHSSFESDPGLKQALDTVNDYAPLMKDFPLNDLLSATELDRIKNALQLIFTHLRKIKATKYPIQVRKTSEYAQRKLYYDACI